MQREMYKAWYKPMSMMCKVAAINFYYGNVVLLADNEEQKAYFREENKRVGIDYCIDRLSVSENYVVLLRNTGLKDKNGKEIYEDDILSFYDIHGIVKFGLHSDDVYNGWYVEVKSTETQCELNKSFSGAEIIGNIYDNSELLQEETKWEKVVEKLI